MPDKTIPDPEFALALKVARLEERMDHQTEAIEKLTKIVDELNATLNKTRGGWFALTVVGSAGIILWQFLEKLLILVGKGN